MVPADELPVELCGLARRAAAIASGEGVEVGRRIVPEGHWSLVCECDVHEHMVASGRSCNHRASLRLAVRLALLQILADQPEEDAVDPLAVSPIRLSLHSLAHEAHALRMTDRPLVEAVALELHAVVVEIE